MNTQGVKETAVRTPFLTQINRLIAALCLSMVFLSGRVQAQTVPAVEIGAGYSFLLDAQDADVDVAYTWGWVASVGWNMKNWLALVGEVGGQHKSYPSPYEGLDIETKAQLRTFMTGPKLIIRRGRFTPFSHVLAGAARFNATATSLDGTMKVLSADHATHGAIQLGGGLDVLLNPRLAFRMDADYRRVFRSHEDTSFPPSSIPFIRRLLAAEFSGGLNQFRLTTGLVVRIASG